MQYRNLNRVLMFTKALRLFNRKRECPLNATDVFLLLAFDLEDGVNGVSLSYILKKMAKIGRSVEINKLYAKLAYFQAEGWLTKGPDKRYNITPLGVNILNELEARCRNTRWDKIDI